MALRCHAITSPEHITALLPEWDSLARGLETPTAYDVGTIALAIAAVVEMPGQPCILTVRTATGTLAGLVPLRIIADGRWFGREHVTSLLSWHGSVFSPLIDPAVSGVASACAQWLREIGLTCPTSLRYMPGECPLLGEFPPHERSHDGAWSWVSDNGTNDFTMHGSSETRRLIRHHIHGGRVQVCIDEPPEAMAEVVARFGELHTLRWQGVPGAAEFALPATRERLAHHLAALRRADLSRVGTLRSEGSIHAVVVTFRVGTSEYAWRAAYDAGKRHISPGRLLLGQMIAAAFADGCTRFVLGRGAEEYKADWPIASGDLWRVAPPSVRWRRLLAGLSSRHRSTGMLRSQHVATRT